MRRSRTGEMTAERTMNPAVELDELFGVDSVPAIKEQTTIPPDCVIS
jgi:hypothetical protein